jgi:hypothetical protein
MDAEEVAALLRDPHRAVPAAEFPRDRDEATHAGMYAWWADNDGLATISDVLGALVAPLVYAGQAGATSARSGKRSTATLLSRVRGQHIRGNVYGSTVRRTFAAVLYEPLGLRTIGPKRLAEDGEARLRSWIEQHLSVGIVPIHDRDALTTLEHAVLGILDPPLNLNHVSMNEARTRLKVLRRRISGPGDAD